MPSGLVAGSMRGGSVCIMIISKPDVWILPSSTPLSSQDTCLALFGPAKAA